MKTLLLQEKIGFVKPSVLLIRMMVSGHMAMGLLSHLCCPPVGGEQHAGPGVVL